MLIDSLSVFVAYSTVAEQATLSHLPVLNADTYLAISTGPFDTQEGVPKDPFCARPQDHELFWFLNSVENKNFVYPQLLINPYKTT